MLDATILPLRNDCVSIRPMRVEDSSAYVAGTTDPLVREYAHLPELEYTQASVEALIQGEIRDGLESGQLAVLTIADPITDAFAGSLVLFDASRESIEVGFWMHPESRGRGLTRPALSLASEFAERSGFTKLVARTVPDNRASQRVLEQAGFSQVGTVRDVAPSGQRVELLSYVKDLVQRAP